MVSFAASQFGSVMAFYAVTLSGIYVNLYLAKLITKNKFASKIVSVVGMNSFHIMALQFLSFKLINIIDILVNKKPIDVLASFPYSNSSYWPLSFLAGLFLPVVMVLIYNKIKVAVLNYPLLTLKSTT